MPGISSQRTNRQSHQLHHVIGPKQSINRAVGISQGSGNAFARACRSEYSETGLCALPSFVLDHALRQLTTEANSWVDDAYFCNSSHNAYLTQTDSQSDSLCRRQEKTFVGSVPYDKIPADSLLNALYQWNPLKAFIGYVLGKSSLFRFADPFGACSVNVFVDGGVHGWHFDESEYTVTLMLQAPDFGGEFEYVPLIRGKENERQVVKSVLDGEQENVVKLPFNPGTLLVFGGRQTLHRVTKISGNTPRLVPVLCFSEEPEAQNSESVRKLFWGRVNPCDPLDQFKSVSV